MLKKILAALGVIFTCVIASFLLSSSPPSDIPPLLFAGEVHYSRIPVEYWEHRIQMIKALGLNSLSVYIMWNYHEVEKGKFDYETGNKNLSLFLDLAEKYDMKVLFRPGPYVCAEWDFGGMPARLLSIDGLVVRANNALFLAEVKTYFQSLVPIIKNHLQTSSNPKGSIVLLQIQNQYGFYGTDKSYIESLRKMWTDLGVDCPQYYVDWVQNLKVCHWTGANIGINNGVSQVQWDFARSFQRTGYLLGGQIYSGWLTHWYEPWQSKDISANEKEYGFLMQNNHSYSMYMVHGGTNFGLTAGANAFVGQEYNYRAHVTSYDYDAPINEQGSSTPKFQALKKLIKQYAKWDITDEPSPIPTMQIDTFSPSPVASLLSNLPSATVSSTNKLIPFQSEELKMFNQGFVVYETKIASRTSFFRAIVHDYGMVFIDGVFNTVLDRSVKFQNDFKVVCSKPQGCIMRVLVEATGHINFDSQMQNDLKGIRDFSDDLGTVFSWTIYTIPINDNIFKWSKMGAGTPQPTLLKAQLSLNSSQIGDTYLDMSQFNKGYVWVNGHNLGRYWSVGPQLRLFCPGVWLDEDTTVFVLEINYDGKAKPMSGKQSLKSSDDLIQQNYEDFYANPEEYMEE